MTHPKLALDSNLTLLFAVGRAQTGMISRHKRLQSYSEADYELLQGFLLSAQQVITTPQAMTEVSNLAGFGVAEPALSRINSSVKGLAEAFFEIYNSSRNLAQYDEFARLGLADCAWLAVLGGETRLLTVDNALYLAALQRGHFAVNFNHVRESLRRI